MAKVEFTTLCLQKTHLTHLYLPKQQASFKEELTITR